MKTKNKQKVYEILKELSGVDTIEESDSLLADIGLDSLGLVTLLVELEEAFQIELEESDLNPFDLIYVADVANLIRRYVEEPNEKSC